MRTITYFYLKSCPYCRQADRILQKLLAANPAYRNIPLQRVEESEQKDLADSFDYYYVPCFFVGKSKLHEGVPSEDAIVRVLDAALQDEQ